ncbi:MAG TPA: hypothetical protein PK926_05065 [Spirochaetota bacterium]|nr:hypothetical protein [Spirochaetota bacterium]HPI88167.1 hypothetical protein [Spirochaetota bacterium]HPR47942.1 hypothetical protein [Spirochaetota bacterium]
MALTRKKYIVDKKFQYGLSFRAIVYPLFTLLTISAILLYFAESNNKLISANNSYINRIIENQDIMIEMFLSTPALQQIENPTIKEGHRTFTENIGELRKIKENSKVITRNSTAVLYILIALTIIQTIVIFLLFIIISHRISGPIQVMSGHLNEILKGKVPEMRPLRKKDELQDFYNNFCKTIKYINEQNKKSN